MRLSPLSLVRSLRRSGRPVVYECRRCGRSLDGDADACPECGARDVARFVL